MESEATKAQSILPPALTNPTANVGDHLRARPSQNEIEQKLIPHEDQVENKGGDQAQPHLRQHDAEHHMQARGAVDEAGLIVAWRRRR